MANWSTSWVPQYPYTHGPTFKTEVTRFESGAEQRRVVWSSAIRTFELVWNNLEKNTMDAIRVFFEARQGAYETFYYPNFAQYLSGTRLACVNSNPDTITDSSSGFTANALGFAAAQNLLLGGSTQGNSDTLFTIASVVAATITLDAGDSLAAESGNGSLAVYRTYQVRFNEDQFMQEFVAPSVSRSRRILLVEVL